MHILSAQILWMTFMRILVITNQGEKKINCFDEMIINIMRNKKFQGIFKEQFIR